MVPEAMSDGHQIVFVVDEDLAVRDSLVFALGLEGFSVRACSSGVELLRHLDLLSARCLVIEDKMSEMDGFEVLAFLASRDLKVPVILLTSHSTPAIRKRAALAGVRHVLEKPLLDGSLVDCLHEILSNAVQLRPIIPA